MRIDYKKLAPGWRWKLINDDDEVICGSIRFFRFKVFCRRDCKKRYLMLQKKRQHWPEYRELK